MEILEKENKQLKKNNVLTDILSEFKIIKEAILVPFIIDKYCNGIPNAISIIQKSKGYIFGVYTEKKWDFSSGCVSDLNAFIFSLDYMKIYFHKKGNSRAIHCVNDYGLYFCDTTGMYNNFFSLNSNYEQNVNDNYEGEEPNKKYELNHGDKNFYAREVEVFQVIFIR